MVHTCQKFAGSTLKFALDRTCWIDGQAWEKNAPNERNHSPFGEVFLVKKMTHDESVLTGCFPPFLTEWGRFDVQKIKKGTTVPFKNPRVMSNE